MKLTIEIEVPDDIDPCTHSCSIYCPFGYYDLEDGNTCNHVKRSDNGGFECIVSKAIEKG